MRVTFTILLLCLTSFAIAGPIKLGCDSLVKCYARTKEIKNLAYGNCLAKVNRGLRYTRCVENCYNLNAKCTGICQKHFNKGGKGFCLIGTQKKDELAQIKHTLWNKY